jgi:hypothetical protein
MNELKFTIAYKPLGAESLANHAPIAHGRVYSLEHMPIHVLQEYTHPLFTFVETSKKKARSVRNTRKCTYYYLYIQTADTSNPNPHTAKVLLDFAILPIVTHGDSYPCKVSFKSLTATINLLNNHLFFE